jgi:hypothetical protein
MGADSLFTSIERYQGRTPWGAILDAGAGPHSTAWVAGLDAPSWCGVTADKHMAVRIRDALGSRLDARGELLLGDWQDESLLHGVVYDTVFADYLLGALDGFAPYFQDRLFARIRRHVGRRLYVVGMEPILGQDKTPQEAWLLRLVQLRNACILLAGHRCYREYPQTWVHRSLALSGFRVAEAWASPIVFRERFVNGQLDVAKRKLVRVKDQELVRALHDRIDALREEGLALVQQLDGLRCSADYVVVAEPIS